MHLKFLHYTGKNTVHVKGKLEQATERKRIDNLVLLLCHGYGTQTVRIGYKTYSKYAYLKMKQNNI
jgi:hypothetical protein